MFNPLISDATTLKDAELEARIQDLTKKLWQTTNYSLQLQLSNVLDIYRIELNDRKRKMWEQQYQKRDKGLDDLIKVR